MTDQMIYQFGAFKFTTRGIEARAAFYRVTIHEALLDLAAQFGQPIILRA